MFPKFRKKLLKKYDYISNKKLLLAVSGGIDSMVLLDLMLKNRMNISIAHCNFSLRGAESDFEQNFITDYCKKKRITLYIKYFDTKKYAEKNKKSIQVAARELRYKWFFELKNKYKFDYIATAHHLDDSLETFFINLLRGTGIDGLVGIGENENIIRPLSDFSRVEIEKYATQNNLKWCEDSSNKSDKYERNNLRNNIIPLFKKLNPSFLHSFAKTIDQLNVVKKFSDEIAHQIINELVFVRNKDNYLNIEKLLIYKNHNFILYKWLSPYGFTAWNDIYNLITAQSGKFVETNEYKLLKNRNELILYQKNKTFSENIFFISENQTEINIPIKLEITLKKTHFFNIINKNAVCVDKKMLKFPLVVRKYKEGEYFCPFGMKGQKKKISKFFKDQKLSIQEKENNWILYSDNQVVWIIGQRLDDRFKITENTTSILKIEHLL